MSARRRIGQGIETVFAQIAADALELPMSRIRGVMHGSTTHVQRGYGSYSSRATVMGGSAILNAAEKLKDAMRAAAAQRFGCEPAEVSIASEAIGGPDGKSAAVERARRAFPPRAPTPATSAPTATARTPRMSRSIPAPATSRSLDYVAVEDVGRIINPLTLHGQCIGAIVQGLGGALLEQFDPRRERPAPHRLARRLSAADARPISR